MNRTFRVLFTWLSVIACWHICKAQYDDYDQFEYPDETANSDLGQQQHRANAKRG